MFFAGWTENNVLSHPGALAPPCSILIHHEPSRKTFANSVPDGMAVSTVDTSQVSTSAIAFRLASEGDNTGLFLLYDIWKFVAFNTAAATTSRFVFVGI